MPSESKTIANYRIIRNFSLSHFSLKKYLRRKLCFHHHVKVWCLLPCWIFQVQILSLPRKLTKLSNKILVREQAGLTAAVVFRNPTIAVDLWTAELGGIALKCKIKYCKLIQILLLLVRCIHITLRHKQIELNPFQTNKDKVFLMVIPCINDIKCFIVQLMHSII